MVRRIDKRFKRDYSNGDMLQYLRGLQKLLGRAPTFRDPLNIPGPSARTIVRRFGKWSIALKRAGIRPLANQLMKGDKSYIRRNWKKMTDIEIATELGVSRDVIMYYRQNFRLWKNRRGTARSTFREKALKIYGGVCEVCGIEICEWHHIIPKSRDPKHWCILCPTCHAVVTRKLVTISSRDELSSKLRPLMKEIYSKQKDKLS